MSWIILAASILLALILLYTVRQSMVEARKRREFEEDRAKRQRFDDLVDDILNGGEHDTVNWDTRW